MATAQAATRIDQRVSTIESALFTHWSVFGRWPGASLHDEDGILWFETPIAHLPYNAVLRTHITPGADAAPAVARVASRFRERGVPFLWVRHPSARPHDLAAHLAAQGLDLVETVTGMDVDLAGWEPHSRPQGADIRAANEEPELLDFATLIRTYWSLSEDARELIEQFNLYWVGDRAPGTRYVAYVDGEPVGKLFLNTTQLPVVGVYGVAVAPAARGRGLATALMVRAMEDARELGADRVVLHSSAMAHSLYRRLDFIDRCQFDIYATGPIFGTHHH